MTIGRAGVVGLGRMGTGIVELLASHGVQVVAVKATPGYAGAAREEVARGIGKRLARAEAAAESLDEVLARVRFTNELEALADVDLVIETAAEDLGAKRALLRRIEEVTSRGTILATCTSSLSLDDLADALERPEQLLALHFFNPVHAMELVELAATARTAPGAARAARAFAEQLGKTVIEVCPVPGFVVNRLLVPYILHALETLEHGVAGAEEIDAAMRLGAAHPMGPLALADLIGLDVVLAMARSLQAELHDPRYRAPSILRRLVLAGHLGKKTGLGVFDYRGAKPVPNERLRIAPPLQRAS